MAIAAVSVSPLGTKGVGVSQYVAGALCVLEKRAPELGLTYELGPMFTTIEGPTAALFTVVAEMHEALFNAGAPRVSTVVKVDDRRDRPATMKGKVESVTRKMQGKNGL